MINQLTWIVSLYYLCVSMLYLQIQVLRWSIKLMPIFLNIFAAQVDEIVEQGKAKVMVRLMLESTAVLASITRKSALDLGLKKGKMVYV